MADELTITDFFDTGGFLGQGWAFPPTFVRGIDSSLLVKGEEDIKQSLGILLSTSMGERVMLADFGCDLVNEVFEPNEPAFRTLITELVRKAIDFYETRVTLNSVDVAFDAEAGLVQLTINYTIKSTNSRSNIVFPYYLNEGTNL